MMDKDPGLGAQVAGSLAVEEESSMLQHKMKPLDVAVSSTSPQ